MTTFLDDTWAWVTFGLLVDIKGGWYVSWLVFATFLAARKASFSSLSNSMVVLFKWWKSSSSAPAPLPVPRIMVFWMVSAIQMVKLFLTRRSLGSTNLLYGARSFLPNEFYHHKVCNSHRSDKHLYPCSSDNLMQGVLSPSIQNRMRMEMDFWDSREHGSGISYVSGSHIYIA